jgi:signal transduction histidine kinase
MLFTPVTISGYLIYYLVASTVLASLLLSVRQTFYFSVFNFAFVLFLIVATPQTEGLFGKLDELFFHIAVPALLMISTVIRNRDREQINRQIVELQRLAEAERLARERAEQSDRVKSAFLASMSHELRTPLNAIINFSKFLKKGLPGPVNQEQEELLGSISDSGQHLLNLINDILDMSKIEAGSLRLYVEPDVNVREIIGSAVQYVQPLLADKPVSLEQSVPETLPLLTGDRKRLLQIVLNVLSNACKFTETGCVRVSVSVEGDKVRICVADSGPGIAPEDRENVFTAFKQTDSGLRQGSGTGLGMPITLKLVEAHQGTIWFESQPGEGTTFYIDLPLVSALEPERAQ